MPILQTKNISLNFGKPVLKNISFEISQGELLVVLGPSGSGKTSLLRCMNRLETIDEGHILLNGQDISFIPTWELRRKVGLVFQTTNLEPMTVRENVALGPRLNNLELDKVEVDKLLEQVGLPMELWEQNNVGILSVGERQRIALAQVLANQPEVLLLDEPASALDPASALKVEESIRNIQHKSETAAILVTHNLEQARRLNAKTLLLINGEVADYGNLEDIMQRQKRKDLKSYFKHRGKS